MMPILTKIQSEHSQLRTDTVEGKIIRMPEVGTRFRMTGPPLGTGIYRLVETSIVQKLINDSEKRIILFDTEFSKYKLEY